MVIATDSYNKTEANRWYHTRDDMAARFYTDELICEKKLEFPSEISPKTTSTRVFVKDLCSLQSFSFICHA